MTNALLPSCIREWSLVPAARAVDAGNCGARQRHEPGCCDRLRRQYSERDGFGRRGHSEMTMGDPDSGTVIHGPVTNLINVGTVNDGFAFPSGAPSLPPPQQLPPALDEFENQAAALDSLRTPRADGPILHLVVGPPGAGKSALTLHWANLDTDRFPDGRIYLDLRGHNRD